MGKSKQGESQQFPVTNSNTAKEELVLLNLSKSAGRLKFFLDQWENITSDSRILSWIKGYEIPFSKPVFQDSVLKEPSWTSQDKVMIRNHIEKLMMKGSVSKCVKQKDHFISNIFLVPKPDGTSRLVLNLKNLNKFIDTQHFKLEDYRLACKLVSPNCFMGKIDLTDAYYMIPIEKNFRKYLRFIFEDNLYEFNCLPFGLNSAPYVFTKVMKPVVGH